MSAASRMFCFTSVFVLGQRLKPETLPLTSLEMLLVHRIRAVVVDGTEIVLFWFHPQRVLKTSDSFKQQVKK